MKRVSLKESNLTPNFIGAWSMEPLSVCDDLIHYFETHKEDQNIGHTASGRNLDIKDRVDISITPKQINLPGNEVFNTYINSLFECYKDYLVEWPFLKSMGENIEIGAFNLGRYTKGQHFQGLHTERSGLDTLHRLFAWMTYLNDVEEGGETFFSHYGIKIKPKKGLTIIWPSEWTHAHKGNVLLEGEKYMITGWMNFHK
jgi:prolyl 4-hydroxylase|tara:strand:+ start:3765 stop:4364 length:600 start_codon:yes stop_codon:yes gene_type:complete